MAIFICYSDLDKEFVNSLAKALVINKPGVWLDRWELSAGDSLVQRVRDDIDEADTLLVVISENSVNSEWCKRELSAGTIRELNDKKVLFLPVIIYDCQLPLLLQEKVHADFRSDFDEGLQQVLKSVAEMTTGSKLEKITNDDYLIDYSVSWGIKDNLFVIKVIFLNFLNLYQVSILSKFEIIWDETATKRYIKLAQAGFDEIAILMVFEIFLGIESLLENKLLVKLKQNEPVAKFILIEDPYSPGTYELFFKAYTLGEYSGKNVLIDCVIPLQQIFEDFTSKTKKLSDPEIGTMLSILQSEE